MQKNNIQLKSAITKATKHLRANCKVMAGFIENKPKCPYEIQEDLFKYLVRAIVYQQLSTKAAATIFERLSKKIKNKFTVSQLLKLTDEAFKECGVSRQKRNYIRNIANYKKLNPKIFKQLWQMSDDEIIAELTKIKGIGEWTVQMMLIFAMGRLNVFPEKDLAVMKSFNHYYKIKSNTSQKRIEGIKSRWSSYASVASWYLWRAYEDL